MNKSGEALNGYIYKLYFTNGCTYIGKHLQKKENDGYITSSTYYKKHLELFDHREIILEHLNDVEILDIMESICILGDIVDNPGLNVNYNRGAWLDPSKFDRGYKGPANGMYGQKMRDHMSEEDYLALRERQRLGKLRRRQEKIAAGWIPPEVRKERRKKEVEINKKFREINKQIHDLQRCPNGHFSNKDDFKKWQSEKASKSHWYHDPIEKKEYFTSTPDKDWVRGRLPHSLWDEEKKIHYKEAHSFDPTKYMSEEGKKARSKKIKSNNKDRVWYTNGENNRYLKLGSEVPEGYWRGFTFTRTEKYINTRRKKGERNARSRW